jgi:phytoene dehydrogenase-like protein
MQHLTAPPHSNTDFDAIIVGAGHNGLVCALYLAKAGYRVLVLEQAADVGGACRSAEVTLPGFTHDLFATNFTLFTASQAYRDFGADLEALGVRFLSNAQPFATGYAGGRAARVFTSEEETERAVADLASDDRAAWQHLVGFFKKTAPRFLPLHSTPAPSIKMLRQIGRIAAGPPSETIALARLLFETPRQFLDRHFQSPEVKGLFLPWAFHLDYGPDVRGGAAFAFISAMSAHLRGIRIIEGGASRLTRALQVLIERHGGQVRTNSNVVSIDSQRNRVTGVRIEGGAAAVSSRVVIANVAPGKLFGTLVDRSVLPSGFYRRMSGFRHGVGTFVVHLALGQQLDWKAGGDLADFNYVHLYGTAPEIERAYAEASAGLLPARPMLIVSQTTQVDPSRAPAGRHVVRIHARAFPAAILGDAGATISGREWTSVREAVADRIIDMLAEHAPNVRSALLARYVMSPADLAQANPNLVNGDCNGGSHHLDQYYFARPALGWSRYSTPIENLYMIGASQWPGSGINGISGHLLASRLIASGL